MTKGRYIQRHKEGKLQTLQTEAGKLKLKVQIVSYAMTHKSWLTLVGVARDLGEEREACSQIPQDVRAYGAQFNPLCVH